MAALPTPDQPTPRTVGAQPDAFGAVAPVSSRLLTTLAIIRTQGALKRDYVHLFEPFVLDRLKAWPAGQPVEPDGVARAITEEFGIPSMPVNVVRTLLARPAARGLLVEHEDRKCYVLPDALCSIPDLGREKTEMLARMNELTDHLRAFAQQRHGLEWDESTASSALERFTEDFGAELALAKKKGLTAVDGAHADQALTVVHSFAREALDRCVSDFDALEDMVKGTMIANTLYFRDVGSISARLPDLCVYFDTRVLMRALGLSDQPLVDATLEMLDMLKSFHVRMFVFPHTIDEMSSALNGVAEDLRRRGPRANQSPGTRETMDALIRLGWNAGKVQEIADGLEQRLRAIGIHQKETPPHSSHRRQIDEPGLDAILKDTIGHGDAAREKDVLSISAVHRLRAGRRPDSLGQARAVFVTHNGGLVRGSRLFATGEGMGSVIPHCMLDMDLSVQLWIRDPGRRPNLPRKLLIADCYAALNPSPDMWRRWTQNIETASAEGSITDEQVQNLLYNQQARSVLFEVTSGDPTSITENTVPEVISRLEERIRMPLERAVEEERETARRLAAEKQDTETRLEAVSAQVDGLRAELDDERTTRRKEKQEWADTRRYAAGVAGAGLAVVVLVLLALAGVVDGKLGWGVGLTVALTAAAAAYAWGTRRPLTWSLECVMAIGAFCAIGGLVASFVENDKPADPPVKKAPSAAPAAPR